MNVPARAANAPEAVTDEGDSPVGAKIAGAVEDTGALGRSATGFFAQLSSGKGQRKGALLAGASTQPT